MDGKSKNDPENGLQLQKIKEKSLDGLQGNIAKDIAKEEDLVIKEVQDEPVPQDKKISSSTPSKKPNSSTVFATGGVILILAIVFAITASIFSSPTSVESPEVVKSILESGGVKSVSVGTVLFSKDDFNVMPGRDYDLEHEYREKNAEIKVWDYAAEDGDYVQVFVNDQPLGEAFMILNKPVSIKVPAVGKISIKGIKDGGGGITYAIYFPQTDKAYFNRTNEGTSNTYNLFRAK